MRSSFNLPQFITCLDFRLSISRIAVLPRMRGARRCRFRAATAVGQRQSFQQRVHIANRFVASRFSQRTGRRPDRTYGKESIARMDTLVVMDSPVTLV